MTYQQIETSQISTSRTTPITGFRGLNGPTHEVHGTRIAPRWSDLPSVIRRERVVGEKHDLGISFADFRERRATNENTRWIFALALDFDALNDDQFQRALAAVAPYARVGWATHSFLSGAKPGWCFRIVLLLKTPRSRDEWDEFWPAAVAHLGIADLVDRSCKNASRLFYLTCPPGHENDFDASVDTLSGSGEEFDVPGFVASFQRPANDVASTIPTLNDLPFAGPGAGVAPCPVGTNPLDWARHLASTMPPSISFRGGDDALFRAARAIRWGLDRSDDEAVEILRDVFNPRCVPPWDEGRLRYKVAEASKPEGAPYARGTLLPSPAAQSATLRSDLGNARLLVRAHGNDLRFFSARDKWYGWDGVRWRADETGEIDRRAKSTAETLWDIAKQETDDDRRKAAFAWALQCQNRQRVDNMIAMARSEPGIPVTVRDLDADPRLLNVQNGVLDLCTGTLRPPTRELLMTKVTAAPFVAGARSALWDRFVSEVTAGDRDLSAYVQRSLGYALFGEWREKSFWFGYGPPDGGKSTFLGAIGDVLGDYHVSASASAWMIQHNTGGNRGDVTRLLGARLVTTLEVREGARFDPELMKKVTGGDKLTAAAKYETDIEFAPTFALWFGANDRPIIPDDDEGFWNRVRCVPFTNVVPKDRQNNALRSEFTSAAHAPAVLAWLVEGFAAWQRDGLGTCSAVEQATTAYRRDMNRAAGFFDECCQLTRNPNDVVEAGALRSRYDSWCRDNGIRNPLRAKAWSKRLRELGVTGGDDASRMNGQRLWSGIRLRG